MSTSNLTEALVTLARRLDELGVTYGLIGGAACSALGSPRVTEDIDLVVGVISSSDMSAEKLNELLLNTPGFVPLDMDNVGYFIPGIDIDGQRKFPVEIFDAASWPMRPQYGEVFTEHRSVTLPDGTSVKVFSPAWLLREKIQATYEREKKTESDLFDIKFLCGVIRPEEYQQGVLDLRNAPQFQDAFRAFVSRTDIDDSIRELIQRIFLSAD